jgi:NAD(P)-dependent dehydrogenase (short-subunit alcohol dehydrogenase family)
MNPYLQPGCTALVTGAASGLGKGLADALAKRGLKVLYADINPAVEQAAQATDSASAVFDVADSAAFAACIDAVVAKHGKLDCIINNAGFALAGEARDCTPEDYRRVVDVNLMGVVNGSLPAYRQMAKQGGGHVVNIASLAGLTPFPMCASYAMTKAGVVNFSHTLRCEGAGLGVRVSVVCPSFIDTPIMENARYIGQNKERLKQSIPFPTLPLDKAVQKTLGGMDKNHATIVFPFHAKLLWRLTRYFHRIPNPVTNKMMRDIRAAR